jgi:hypothetical protein
MSIASTPVPVMAVLVTAIHVFPRAKKDVDARDKPAHDVVAGR